ncbi:MAG: hypothetical protein JSW67_14495 [Candidatus Latescibacterota bacterium]|nr:MAG: hypothetical protein JSW67_14495 [Candidatus Latescibacterota bacterium]
MKIVKRVARLAALCLLVLTTFLAGRVGQAHVRARATLGVSALPAVSFLEVLALGYREAAADLAWMQCVQYYGEHRQGGNDLSEFGHYLDAVNTLDPRYAHAYVLGSVVLATDGGDLDAALEVLRRGSRANPESWVYPFEMGFLTFVTTANDEAAARYFDFAAQYPEGRDRALRFQAFLNRKLGRLETAWVLWNDLAQTTDNRELRIVAEESLRKIEAAMRERALQPATPATNREEDP